MARSPWPALPKFFLWLLPLSFLLQVAAIALLHEYRTRPADDHFAFGWEMGRVARSIALGHGFGSPYEGNTGPTAWEPPIYPYVMGGVFKVFGIYTQSSAWALLIFNSLLAALTCIPIFFIARHSFDDRIAFWSSVGWGLCPYVWYWSIHWLWDTTFTPLLLACLFWISLELADVPGGAGAHASAARPGLGKWILFGALFGIGALANPTMLSFLPFSGLWIWHQRYRRGLPSLAGVVLASFVFFVALSPWLVRNYEAFGRFVFIRDDFGLQFRLGNGPSADGMLMPQFQPNLNDGEFVKFKEMGELAYGESCKRFAFDWVREHPDRFAVISLKRFFYYWNGVPKATGSVSPVDFRSSAFLATSVLALWGLVRMVRQKRPAAWLYAGLVLTYPTVYYFVYPHARYRHPIEPELTILIVFLIFEAVRGQKMAPSNEL